MCVGCEWNAEWHILISHVRLSRIFGQRGVLGDWDWFEFFQIVEVRIYFRSQGIICISAKESCCFWLTAITFRFVVKSYDILNSCFYMNLGKYRSFVILDSISIFRTINPTWNHIRKVRLIFTSNFSGCLWILLAERESGGSIWAIKWSNLA